MSRIDKVRNLPVPAGGAALGNHARGSTRADFLSQLIAERQHAGLQRIRRRAPLADALRTYDAGGRLSVRRMPPGYRMSFEA